MTGVQSEGRGYDSRYEHAAITTTSSVQQTQLPIHSVSNLGLRAGQCRSRGIGICCVGATSFPNLSNI